MLMALGMLLLGTSVLVSGRLAGIRRLVPLVVGVYFPAAADDPAALFLNGEDEPRTGGGLSRRLGGD